MFHTLLLILALVLFILGSREIKLWGFHLGWIGAAVFILSLFV
jgi:hypothetical protein